ncbi:MAG: enoyl-CoA hydratase/isomerase family protein [Sphingobium sp.]
MTYSDIIVTRQDRIGTIAINRPAANNSVSATTMDEIGAAVAELTADESVRVLVLTSTGKHFVAGAEFSFLQDLATTPSLTVKDKVYTSFQGAARALYHCPKPTLAAFSGAAVTVGCELAVACDFRIVSETAFFQESWIKLGILPPLGGMMLLPRLVGLGLATDMVLRGRAVKAEEALRSGLVHEVVPVDALAERITAFATELAAIAPQAYAAAKQGLHRGLESTMEKEWAANVLAQSLLLGSDDFKEGLAAVMQKRAPAFEGR